MATRSEIRRNIDNTRSHLSYVIDEISDTVHKRVDWQQKIKDNPAKALAIAVAAGFVLSSIASPITRPLLRFGMKSAFAALGAYASREGMKYITKKIQSA